MEMPTAADVPVVTIVCRIRPRHGHYGGSPSCVTIADFSSWTWLDPRRILNDLICPRICGVVDVMMHDVANYLSGHLPLCRHRWSSSAWPPETNGLRDQFVNESGYRHYLSRASGLHYEDARHDLCPPFGVMLRCVGLHPGQDSSRSACWVWVPTLQIV